jgi:limonene-1,2-epoxide hydrolase
MTASSPDTAHDIMIRDFLAAWEGGDSDRVASYFTDDAVYHNIPMKPVVGKTAIRESIHEFCSQSTSRPAMRIEIHRQLVSGEDTVVAQWTCQGTNTGPLTMPDDKKLPATGRSLELAIVPICEVIDGKVAGEHEYFDGATTMSQLGPAPRCPHTASPSGIPTAVSEKGKTSWEPVRTFGTSWSHRSISSTCQAGVRCTPSMPFSSIRQGGTKAVTLSNRTLKSHASRSQTRGWRRFW